MLKEKEGAHLFMRCRFRTAEKLQNLSCCVCSTQEGC